MRCWKQFVIFLIMGSALVPLNTVRHESKGDGLEDKPLTPFDQPSEAQEFFLLKRIPVGETVLPVEKYLRGLDQMKDMPRFSTSLEAFLPSRREMDFIRSVGSPTEASEQAQRVWTQLGPGNIGGRTRALLIDPTNPNTMYAAGVAGGIWKTTNGGSRWTPLDDLLPNLAVNSMAMDPTNPNVIYAGTGEGFMFCEPEAECAPGIRGAGIFKTTDGGASLTHLASNNANFHFVNDLVVSLNNSQQVYAATSTGVWRSTDGGTKWTRVLNPNVKGGCLDLAIRTDQRTDYIFTSCGTFEQATIYRNADAGNSDPDRAGPWTPVWTEAGMGRTSLAIAPSNQNVIYALAASIAPGDFKGGLHAVFRSTSSGDLGTWEARVRNTDATRLNTVLLTNPACAFLKSPSGCPPGTLLPNKVACPKEFINQGWYDNVIAVDPVDPNRVWAGGIDLFRSDDGGANWGLATYWWAEDLRSGRRYPQYAHADQHVIVFHPQYDGIMNKIMFVGNDGGIFRTNDACADVATDSDAPCQPSSSIEWTALNNNYGVTQFYHGVPFPDGETYFGGTQDNGTILGTDSGGIPEVNGWRTIVGGDGGYVAVDPTNTNILYAENTGLSIQKSTNGGANFKPAINNIVDTGFMFIAPFIMDPCNSQRLWTGGQFLWRTTDGANNWTQAISRILGGSVSAVTVAPTNPNHILAGTSGGYIHRTDHGLTSTRTTTWPFTRPRDGFVSSLIFDPMNEDIAYATYSTFDGVHVWKSANGGETWMGIDGSGEAALPNIPVHTIVVDPSNTSRLYIGTDLGVFVSLDGGATWAVEDTGFANVITEVLAVNISEGIATLFAFTHGRGAWRITLGEAPSGVLCCEGEPNSNQSSAIRVTPGVTQTGVICPEGDVDFFSFNATKDQVFSIRTIAQALDPPSDADTVITLFDENEPIPCSTRCSDCTPDGHCGNDDYGGSLDSLVIFAAPATGRYYIRVRDATDSGGPTYTYQLVVTLLSSRAILPELLLNDHAIKPLSIGTLDALTTIRPSLPLITRTLLPVEKIEYATSKPGLTHSDPGTMTQQVDSLQESKAHSVRKSRELPKLWGSDTGDWTSFHTRRIKK